MDSVEESPVEAIRTTEMVYTEPELLEKAKKYLTTSVNEEDNTVTVLYAYNLLSVDFNQDTLYPTFLYIEKFEEVYTLVNGENAYTKFGMNYPGMLLKKLWRPTLESQTLRI